MGCGDMPWVTLIPLTDNNKNKNETSLIMDLQADVFENT